MCRPGADLQSKPGWPERRSGCSTPGRPTSPTIAWQEPAQWRNAQEEGQGEDPWPGSLGICSTSQRAICRLCR